MKALEKEFALSNYDIILIELEENEEREKTILTRWFKNKGEGKGL